MATCSEVPRYELVSTKKCPPEEEKYHEYLLETLNKKPKNNNLIPETQYPSAPPQTSKVFYGQTCSNYPNAGYNSTVNYYNYTNAFTGFNRLPKQTELEFGMPIEDENDINNKEINFEKFKTEETFNLNTLQQFDKNLEELKRENHLFKKYKGKNTNPSKNYISQEEIKQKKEEIFGSYEELLNYIKSKKEKGVNWFKRFVKLSEEKGIHLCDLMEAKTPQELEALIQDIIKKEEESEKEREKMMETYNLKSMKKKGVIRKGYTSGKPLDERDYRFIKKYARYLLFKKIKDAQIGFNDDDNERIYSQKIFNNMDKEAKSNVSSFVAFAKLVFSLLDKDQNGFITKDYLISNITLDDRILKDLGFENENNFKQLLLRSNKNNNISEKDFINILLSQAGILEDYNNLSSNMNNMNLSMSSYDKKRKSNTYNEDVVKISDDEDSDFDLPGLRTHVYDFLELPDNYQKLEALKKLEEENLYDTKKSSNKLGKKRKKILLDLSRDRKIAISYHEYLTFLRRFHRKDQINFTIPEPFDFLKKNYQKKKIQKIKEILEDRVKDEDYFVYYQFHANELKKGIWGNRMQNIIEYEKEQRQQRTEKLKEKIIAEMKPFSFYEKDERKYKEKIKQESIPPTFPPFRANAIKWLSQVLIYEDMLKQEKEEREQRIKERMLKTAKTSKLPPRMALYEEERIAKEKQKELDLKRQLYEERENRKFKAKKVPEFTKLQTEFENKLKEMKEKRKREKKAIKPIPFTFHEPKKKVAELCQYLDQENDHEAKNPKFGNKDEEIKEIIKKMQRKPKIEPKSTHSLDLLMELRRKELEDKENQQKLKELEDNIRAEHQARLRERVWNSKALVDHRNQLKENEIRRKEEFREELQKQEESYRNELARRLDRVYNRPLLVEQVGNKGEKFSLNRNNIEDLDELQMQFGPIAEEDEYEQQIIGEDEGDDGEAEGEGEEEGGEEGEGEKIEEEADGEKEENGEEEDKK